MVIFCNTLNPMFFHTIHKKITILVAKILKTICPVLVGPTLSFPYLPMKEISPRDGRNIIKSFHRCFMIFMTQNLCFLCCFLDPSIVNLCQFMSIYPWWFFLVINSNLRTSSLMDKHPHRNPPWFLKGPRDGRPSSPMWLWNGDVSPKSPTFWDIDHNPYWMTWIYPSGWHPALFYSTLYANFSPRPADHDVRFHQDGHILCFNHGDDVHVHKPFRANEFCRSGGGELVIFRKTLDDYDW